VEGGVDVSEEVGFWGGWGDGVGLGVVVSLELVMEAYEGVSDYVDCGAGGVGGGVAGRGWVGDDGV
jgi:hypothetical protein